MSAEVLRTVRDVLRLDSRPGETNSPLMDYLMDRLYYGEFHMFEQHSSSYHSEHVNLSGIKDPGTDTPPLWLLSYLETGADPVPAHWKKTGGDPLNAHLDEHGGFLYGLGGCMGKADFILKLLAASQFPVEDLKRPICLVALLGEEGRGTGIHGLIDGHHKAPDAALLSAPTNLELWNAHPGFVSIRFELQRSLQYRRMPPSRGIFTLDIEGHSAHCQMLGLGRNVLQEGLDIISRLREHGTIQVLSFDAGEGSNRVPAHCRFRISTSYEELPPLPGHVKVEAIPDGAAVPFPVDKMLNAWLRAKNAGIKAISEMLQEANYTPGTRPHMTVHTGRLETDREIVAGHVSFWPYPGMEIRSAIEQFATAVQKSLAKKEDFEGHVIVVQERPAFHDADESNALLSAAKHALSEAGVAPVVSGGVLTTDAGLLQESGTNCLAFGPGRGMGDLFRDNERVPVLHLARAYDFYVKFIQRWCC